MAKMKGVNYAQNSGPNVGNDSKVPKKRLSYLLHEAHEQQGQRYGYHIIVYSTTFTLMACSPLAPVPISNSTT